MESDSLAARARAAVDDRPFLRAALAADVVNYAAAARTLDLNVEPDDIGPDPSAEPAQSDTDSPVEPSRTDAVAAALRRYAEELDVATDARSVRVTMEGRLGETDETGLLSVNGTRYASGAGSLTGVLAAGDVDARALAAVLDRLDAAGVEPEAARFAGDALLVVVPRRDGPDAVRLTERALDAVPRVVDAP
ncbi:DUF7523 family protein [Halocalculus aciditolerans]|uniref:Uncharacterized protein n=1 Tax=Halocalculus aciditolerans TaxID=1383812 RepID=A0A830FHW4_9EURY|nr:hypothetical protein [Halocalculus aciditolerans]GGL56757.1 hypothetical protein GCM10009039_13650 [Halocalculus aciditolerans]